MILLALGGCSSAAPMVKVEDILAHCDLYKGKAVQATGYLADCGGHQCFLAAHKPAWNALVRAWEQMGALSSRARADQTEADKARDRVHALWPIGLGGDEAFDRKAAPLQFGYVVVTGRVAKDTCTGEGGTDRSAGIIPTDIRAWTPPAGAPGYVPDNTH